MKIVHGKKPRLRPGNSQSGMGLMEGLAVLGVMTIVLVLVSEIFAANMNLITTQLRRTDTSTGAIQAVRRMTERSRGASAIVASHTFDGETFSTSTDTLVLQLPTVDSNGDIVANTYDYVAFYRDSTDPKKVFSVLDPGAGSGRPAGARLMSAYNDLMMFRYNDPDETSADRVSIYIENSRTYRDKNVDTKAWTAIFLRNR